MENDLSDSRTLQSLELVVADLRSRNRNLMDAVRLVYELTSPDTLHQRDLEGVVAECRHITDDALFRMGEQDE